jgi:hypothetical protein
MWIWSIPPQSDFAVSIENTRCVGHSASNREGLWNAKPASTSQCRSESSSSNRSDCDGARRSGPPVTASTDAVLAAQHQAVYCRRTTTCPALRLFSLDARSCETVWFFSSNPSFPIHDFDAVLELIYEMQVMPPMELLPAIERICHPGGHAGHMGQLTILWPRPSTWNGSGS